MIEPPPLTKGRLSLEDSLNPLDLMRLNQALKDEGDVEYSFFPKGVEYLRSIQKLPSCTRNLFKSLKQGARQNFALQAPVSITSIEATVNLNLESKESSVNTCTGYEEPHLRRREIKNFSFERNKTEEFEEDLLVKKEKLSPVPSFIARKPLQRTRPFDDPLSSNPLNKKLISRTNSPDFSKAILKSPVIEDQVPDLLEKKRTHSQSSVHSSSYKLSLEANPDLLKVKFFRSSPSKTPLIHSSKKGKSSFDSPFSISNEEVLRKDVKNACLNGDLAEEVYMSPRLDLKPNLVNRGVVKTKEDISISQRKYTLDLLTETGMLGCRPAETLIEFKKLCVVSQFIQAPNEEHMEVVDRILRYLKTTLGKGLMFRKTDIKIIEAYTDSNWAGSIVDRKSTSASCAFVWSILVTWRSKKQSFMARSSAEAEYWAMSLRICEKIWLQKVLSNPHHECETPTKLLCDNKAIISIANNPVQHDRTKHVEIDRHFIKGRLDNGSICIPYILSSQRLLMFSPWGFLSWASLIFTSQLEGEC
ncbi:Cysteine-rich RLK (receptor-like protein kinase) 8 [Cucumis melo var. makuwa]|uniref:Cysteine-rich RLK (Receptor-like protein kinase) 8 n=1 Tax=Cucumis melo var. makuwa TaxID=1194695 RepID=A0A5A7UAY9_CUCMM|nr:Cysteine-rich RLK (receptor-like protein kinase) 8 [Cucumis melo var. makuwa]TYJ95488.1 Cysteine-rich RLK (receptor-like protein kinase) 8 [Cucumis melo var. makuwa]